MLGCYFLGLVVGLGIGFSINMCRIRRLKHQSRRLGIYCDSLIAEIIRVVYQEKGQ